MGPTRSVLMATVLVSTAVAWTAGGADSPSAAQDAGPGGGLLALASAHDGDFDIYVTRPDGSDRRNLTLAPTIQDLDPAWSPDGTRIAFSRYLPGNPTAELFVMDADGRGRERLTSDPGQAHDRDPAWRPDGGLIAFTRSVPARGTSRIFLIRPDGTRLRRLTDTPPGRYDASPAWSPSGSRIAFVSNRATSFPEIWAMNVTQIDSVHLTWNKPVRLTWNSQVDGNPEWSPDGSRIAFERCCPGGSSDIFVMNADGTGTVRLTSTPENESDPTWSPDGTRIAYAVYPADGGNRDVSVTSLDGADSWVLPLGPGADVAPDWGPPAAPEGQASQGTVHPSRASAGAASSAGGAVRREEKVVRAGEPAGAVLPRFRVRTERVMEGVRLLRIWDRRGPNRVFALQVDPLLRPTMDVALAQQQLPGRARTSDMARSHRAVAAVNGDFGMPPGRPVHSFAEDGDLKQTALGFSRHFAISQDEREVYLRPPAQTVTALQTGSGDVLRVDRWNRGEPTWGEVTGYSSAGGTLELPPRNACSVRLVPAGRRRWSSAGVARDHKVDLVRCSWRRMPRDGGIVVSAQPSSLEGTMIRSLRRGETVTVTWSFGWARVADSLGGFPLLLKEGEVVVGTCSAYLCYRHPRTGIGVTGDGRLLLVVVDGRRKRSVGMTLVEFARLFRRLGARSALNLDGGGSSTMVVRGQVINRPSDGPERHVTNALLVLRGSDPGEEIGAAGAPGRAGLEGLLRSVPAVEGWGRGPGLDAALDPGSTGGLADALARGVFGPVIPMPPELRAALRTFRSAGYAGAPTRATPTTPG